MSQALRRFSIPHECKFLEAKRLLVDKIVNTVTENTSDRIIALLREELQKRGVQFAEDDEEEEEEEAEEEAEEEEEL
ncbi:hypothetical protein N0V85_008900 [Neurospora sp. IMI 360204]|nr:hypothetical protein N0V85_008900 [Neurospora sp. IMI 360204]